MNMNSRFIHPTKLIFLFEQAYYFHYGMSHKKRSVDRKRKKIWTLLILTLIHRLTKYLPRRRRRRRRSQNPSKWNIEWAKKYPKILGYNLTKSGIYLPPAPQVEWNRNRNASPCKAKRDPSCRRDRNQAATGYNAIRKVCSNASKKNAQEWTHDKPFSINTHLQVKPTLAVTPMLSQQYPPFHPHQRIFLETHSPPTIPLKKHNISLFILQPIPTLPLPIPLPKIPDLIIIKVPPTASSRILHRTDIMPTPNRLANMSHDRICIVSVRRLHARIEGLREEFLISSDFGGVGCFC